MGNTTKKRPTDIENNLVLPVGRGRRKNNIRVGD